MRPRSGATPPSRTPPAPGDDAQVDKRRCDHGSRGWWGRSGFCRAGLGDGMDSKLWLGWLVGGPNPPRRQRPARGQRCYPRSPHRRIDDWEPHFGAASQSGRLDPGGESDLRRQPRNSDPVQVRLWRACWSGLVAALTRWGSRVVPWAFRCSRRLCAELHDSGRYQRPSEHRNRTARPACVATSRWGPARQPLRLDPIHRRNDHRQGRVPPAATRRSW